MVYKLTVCTARGIVEGFSTSGLWVWAGGGRTFRVTARRTRRSLLEADSNHAAWDPLRLFKCAPASQGRVQPLLVAVQLHLFNQIVEHTLHRDRVAQQPLTRAVVDDFGGRGALRA